MVNAAMNSMFVANGFSMNEAVREISIPTVYTYNIHVKLERRQRSGNDIIKYQT